jgi:hypothetical protein
VENHRGFISLVEEELVNQVDDHRDERNRSDIASAPKDLARNQLHQGLHDAFSVNSERSKQQEDRLSRTNQQEWINHHSSTGHAMGDAPEGGPAECQDQVYYIGMQRY